MGDAAPPSSPSLEVDADLLERIKTVTVTRAEVGRLAANDKCIQRLQRELKAEREKKMPARAEIEAAKKHLKMAHQKLCELQSARETRAAAERLVRAKISHRLMVIAEREEARRVRAIRLRIAPEFRGLISSAHSGNATATAR